HSSRREREPWRFLAGDGPAIPNRAPRFLPRASSSDPAWSAVDYIIGRARRVVGDGYARGALDCPRAYAWGYGDRMVTSWVISPDLMRKTFCPVATRTCSQNTPGASSSMELMLMMLPAPDATVTVGVAFTGRPWASVGRRKMD